MSKDFKPRQVAKKSSGGGTLLGVFIGLILGLALAAGIAVYINKTPIPFLDKAKPAEKAAAPKAAATPNLADTLKTAPDKAGDKPRFDFYKILPGQEEPMSEQQIRQAAKDAAKAPADGKASKDIFLLQAGAFQNPADADNLKAKLALLGVEASVEPTNLAEKGTWYRVRIGPYTKIDDLNRTRSTLAQNGIEATLVKVKDAAKN
ncbi:MAG: SPOR domain-containing protein [Betaproteobacteria bacterium]